MSRTSEPIATIFDIQRCALHDGPGIRTNVFFTGCPLRCVWCHNPESQGFDTSLSYKAQLCRGCQGCAAVCERGVHTFVHDGKTIVHKVDHSKCNACGKCVAVCCYGALELVNKQYSVRELIEEIKIDIPYYAEGERGGVTFTGGEPMLHVGFIKAFADQAPDLHLCMETCGYASKDDFLRILPNIDLFLFDYKITDRQKHRIYCGTDNDKILENLDFLYERGAEIILRLPIIPSVNDDEEHFAGIADILRRYPRIDHAQIMPYHTLGDEKVDRFGLSNKHRSFETPSKEMVDQWLVRFSDLGVSNIWLS